MIRHGHFNIDCTCGIVDTADDTAYSPVVGIMQTTITAESPVMDTVLNYC